MGIAANEIDRDSCKFNIPECTSRHALKALAALGCNGEFTLTGQREMCGIAVELFAHLLRGCRGLFVSVSLCASVTLSR